MVAFKKLKITGNVAQNTAVKSKCMVIAKWRTLESLVLHKTKQKCNMTSTEVIKMKGKQQERGRQELISVCLDNGLIKEVYKLLGYRNMVYLYYEVIYLPMM